MTQSSALRLVEAITAVWAALRGRHRDVPDVFVTVGAGEGPRGLKLGHFAAGAWQHHDAPEGTEAMAELFVGGEGLRRGADELLVTLLHEAAHGIAHTRGVKDTSRQGRWHNRKFQRIAAEVGLEVSRSDSIGWSVSALNPTTGAAYADELHTLTDALVAHRLAHGGGVATTPKKPTFSASCLCSRRIRLSRTMFDAGPIVCGICGEEFASDLEDDPDTHDGPKHDDTQHDGTQHDGTQHGQEP